MERHNNKVLNLLKVPKKDKGLNMPHTQVLAPGYIQQADLLFMPDDDGYKYILVVVDLHTKKLDAEPLKSKDSTTVLKAFKDIYKRGILSIPKLQLEIDSGSEFSKVKPWIEKDLKILVKVAKVARHRRMALVERKNQLIGLELFKSMIAEELTYDEVSVDWVENLEPLIKILNDKAKPSIQLHEDAVCEGNVCQLIPIGTKVRAIAEYPRDVFKAAKRLHGGFRTTDIRFEKEPRIVKEIIIKPGFPPLYLLDGKLTSRKFDGTGYTKNQLQVIPKDEFIPKVKPKKYSIEKILLSKMINGKLHYKIKWLGFPLSQSTWEPSDKIIEDVPELVEEFNKQ